MRVLIACEFSGTVRDAFIKKGHDAVSCDLRETESPGPHLVGDATSFLSHGWDLLIAHPPCTYLSYAANGYWNRPGRDIEREKAADLFMKFINAPIKKICVENPLGYMGKVYRKPNQIIHPYYFGEPELKRTCLWLKNLPPLWFWKTDDLFGKKTATDFPKPNYIDKKGKKRYFTDAKTGTGHGEKYRSKTFVSIAAAMAEQWGKVAPLPVQINMLERTI